MTVWTRSIAVASVLLVALSIDVVARADEPATPPEPSTRTSVQKLSDEGAALYQAREYRRALEKFQRAYAIDSDPNLLYNMGKCHEALGEKAAAIQKYEEFVAEPGADPRGKARAQDALRALKASPSSAQGGTAPAAGRGTPEQKEQKDQKDQKSSTPATLAWVALGSGVVLTGAGLVVYVLGAGDHSKITDARNFDQPGQVVDITESRANDLRASGITKKTIGGVLVGVGAAAFVTSAVLFILQSRTEGGSVTVGAAPLPGGAAAAFSGRF